MEFKGTKGDWYKTYRNGSWLIQDYDCYIEDSKGCIAEVYWFNDGLDTAEANAKLISCAPEMLEMLKNISNALLMDEMHTTLIHRLKNSTKIILESIILHMEKWPVKYSNEFNHIYTYF